MSYPDSVDYELHELFDDDELFDRAVTAGVVAKLAEEAYERFSEMELDEHASQFEQLASQAGLNAEDANEFWSDDVKIDENADTRSILRDLQDSLEDYPDTDERITGLVLSASEIADMRYGAGETI